jgi:hypothetical protein
MNCAMKQACSPPSPFGFGAAAFTRFIRERRLVGPAATTFVDFFDILQYFSEMLIHFMPTKIPTRCWRGRLARRRLHLVAAFVLGRE